MNDELTTTLDQKLADLKRIAVDADTARGAAEAQLRHDRAEDAEAQRRLIKELMDAQAAEAKVRAERQVLWNKILTAVSGVLVSIAGAGVYTATRSPTDEEARQAAQPVIDEIKVETRDVESRVKKAEAKIERLKDVALEQQVQISEDGEYTRTMIKAAHPERVELERLEPPPAVKAAKDKADAIKRRREAERRDLFEADPFADIGDP